MDISTAVFYLIAIITVGSAAIVAFSPNIIYSAFSLLGTFAGVAGLYVFLGADFVAGVQVLIYVGAITVLILYGVMFTPQSPRPYGLFFQTQKLWAALFVVPIAVFVALVAFQFRDSPTVGSSGGDLLPLATSIFGDFAFPFEVASVLLLAAMVGAIVLVKRDEE